VIDFNHGCRPYVQKVDPHAMVITLEGLAAAFEEACVCAVLTLPVCIQNIAHGILSTADDSRLSLPINLVTGCMACIAAP